MNNRFNELNEYKITLLNVKSFTKCKSFIINLNDSDNNDDDYELLIAILNMMTIFDHVKHMMIVKQLTEETTLTISSQCTLSLAPENIRKPYSFLISSGGRQRVHLELMG